MIPPDLKIIKVGESEVGIQDLGKILRKVYFLGIEDEEVLKEELMEKVREKNYIPEKMKSLYEEALLREYQIYARSQWPIKTFQKEMKKKSSNIFQKIFRKMR